MKDTVIWKDKRRPLFGKPWSFTTYILYPDRLIVKSGLVRIRTDILMLYRILDIAMTQTFFDRMFDVGTIQLSTADKSTPKLSILSVKDPERVLNMISDRVEDIREAKGIRPHEFIRS